MKQMNKTKKIKTSVVLKTIVVLIALFAILLNSIMGITKAEYFKKLSKSLDFEVMPDLPLEYYLYHAGNYDSTTFRPESGIYYNSDSFMQYITPGKANTVNYTTTSSGSTTGTGATSGPSGANVVYQIKIPVDETGYYTLDFLTYMILGNASTYINYLSNDFYTLSYRYCVGCEVLTSTDDFEFGVNKPLSMANRIFAGDALATANSTSEKLLYSDSTIAKDSAIPKDSVYQWKTMCPYRAENVSLTFKVEQADVDKGYVIWGWDFSGLEGGWNYTLFVENLSVNKRMELDGTTKYRDNNTPYFMFPQTAYANNIKVEGTTTNNDSTGMGRSRYSAGRGTYVTEATDNSLGMRAELLYGNDKGKDNPLSLYIPLKNVQRGATYKVTFDFSVARQGIHGPDSTKKNGWNGDKDLTTEPNPPKFQKDWHSYNSGFANIFNEEAWSSTDSRMFQSYLVSGATTQTAAVVKTSRNGHRDAQDIVQYANKNYTSYQSGDYTYGYPLTKYDEVIKYNKNYASSLTAFPDYTTSTNINDTYSIGAKQGAEDTYTSTSMRNFFNAVQHTEYNGQYEIHWITFYNTTFSFNIANDVDLDDLYWVWAIDALRYTAFYNLKIENVRIERVVDFASELDANGVKIGDNQIGTAYMDNYGVGTGDEDKGPFNNYRGWNSTGQNYQARGHATTTYLPKGNIYAPIIDASKFTFSKDSDYIIALDGKAVLKGGVDRYVYSIDGGRTWADMEFRGGKASATQLTDAEAGIDLSVKGQTPTSGGTDMIEFNSGDASNASFDNFALSVNLVKYKQQANLDIIIAAVPNNHPDYRCEILRIVNFNQIKNYVSFPYDFVSDIEVTNKIYNANGEKTPLNAHRIKDDSSNKGHYYYTLAKAEGTGFTQMKTVRLDTKVPTSTTAYARMGAYSYAYEDVRAAWTGFAVKNTLGFTGWAIVESGIQKYVWSVDGGKTWSDCSGTPKTRNLVNTGYKKMFYDGSEAFGDELKELHDFEDSINGLFGGVHADHGSMLTADLSGHVGEVVDVIFAAKPKDSEVYVPVGRVDNVAVYGDPTLDVGTAGRGMGTFCTHMNEVRIDDQEYKNGIRMTLRYDPNDNSNSFARMNWIASASLGIETATLNYLEPYHVNPVNARFFNETVQEVKSGGRVEIEGFTVVEGGVKQYKYSLDGGETWTILHTTQQKKYSEMWNGTGEYAFKTKALAAANACGISLDGNNGNNVSYTHEDNAWLVVNLPALPAGVEKNLLVVAESNIDNGEKNADGTSKGKGFIYPVLHMKIRIKNEGVGYFLNDANGAKAGRYSHGSFSQTFETGSSAAGTSYKLTFPVSKEGVHTLTFNAALTSTAQNSGTITTSVLHEQTEKGGERYFASKEADKSNGGTVDDIAKREITNAFTPQDVDFYFNATAEDVKRGYVVLDFDLSKLTANANYVLNIDNLMYSYGVKSTKRLVTDEHGNASYTIRVPALEVGTHNFAFSSYASSYGSIIHNGLDQTVCQGYTKRAYGGNYLAAGAYMSVEKNVFMVGEPIHVSYKAAGAKTSPWIGVTKSVDGRDVVVGRVFLEKDAVGKVTFRSGMYGCVEVIDSLADLPAGDYKLYFRDNSANIYCDKSSGTLAKKGEYWPEMNITDPIAITIIDPNKSNEKPCKQTYSFDDVCYYWTSNGSTTYSRVSGWVSIDKTVFRVGDDISFDCEKCDPAGNPLNDDTVYLGFLDPKYYEGLYLNDCYRGSFEEKIIDITKAPNYPDPGRYQLYCCDFGFATARKSGSVMGALDIVMLPQMDQPSTLTMSYDHLKKNDAEQRVPYNPISAYDYSRNSISIDITQADVDRGYVEFEYELTGLVKEEEVIYTTEMFYDRPIEKEPYTIEGDYVLFGEYPQSLKPNGVTIPEGTKPDNRGYYKGSDDNYYVKVIANPFGNDYVFDNGTTKVENAAVYYFKVEPIRWRILKAEGSSYMDLICDRIIMNGAYDVDSNNYALSDVRAWLNKTFYETAFTEFQRSYIMSVTVDNSLASTGYSSNPYVSADNNDKIYLPSYKDVTNTSYNFMPNASDWDTNRAKHVTDYAKATGAFANMLQYDGNFANGIWMLRSPANSASYFIRECYYNGEITDGGIDISITAHGIVPMVRVALTNG